MSSVIDHGRGRRSGLLAVACVLALALAGCGSDNVAKTEPATQYIPPEPAPAVTEPEPEPELTDPYENYQASLIPAPGEMPVTRAALLLPLSGRHAAIGQALLNAAQMALFDVADDNFALVVRDTQGTPEGAQLAIRSALEERVNVVLGPLFGASAFAVAADTRPLGLNMLTFSNDQAVAGNGVFIAGMPPSEQVERIVDYATRQGLLRFALLAPETAYGTAVAQAYRRALSERGAELVRSVSYNPATSDITPEIRVLAQYDERHQALVEEREKLEALEDEASKLALERLENLDTLGKPDFDAVMLPLGGRSLLSIAPSLAFFDVDPAEVQYLGTALWNDPSLGNEPTLQGGWFAAPSPALWEGFLRRYRNTYGATPPRIATLAYDITALAAVLARTTSAPGQAPDFSVERLTDPSGFSGIDGLFRFSARGAVERGLAILEVNGQDLREIEPAPQSFEGLFN
ncbi:MAG: penicillin-binding protein activator [Kiloniellales bacterium]|nr:penicillin-binding protein activator [Kiloniellales bacterium]